jgi:Flp pilus assembly protein TadB
MSSNQDRLSRDTVFDILSSPRRRYVLYYLRKEGGPVELTDLAAKLAEWEYDVSSEELTEQQRKRIYVSLYQTHVPRLASAGLIDYDSDSGLITLTDDVYQIDQFLPNSDGDEFPWHRLYLALAALGVVAFAVGVLDQGVFAAVPLVAVTVLVIVLFAAVAVAQYYSRLRSRREIPFELLKNNDD